MRTISQRNADLTSVLRAALSTGSKELRCACPAIVQSWDAEKQTVTAKLAIKEMLSVQGVQTETEIPLLVDVPVVMPRAGGFSLVFVPKPGDECLVVFADMCIDSWWQSGGIQSQAERRRHDLSDGFAIMGCWSQQRKPSFPIEGCRLQNDDGSVSIALDSAGCHFNGIDIGIRDLYSNDYGVAVGQETTATEDDKKFEVADDHKAYLNGGAEVTSSFAVYGSAMIDGTLEVRGSMSAGGIAVNGAYSTDPTAVGTWIDGRTIYRKVYTGVTMTNGTSTFQLDITVAQPINLTGFIKQGSAWHPITSYYSSTYHAYVRFDSASTLTMHGMSGMSDGIIILDYIPA